MFHFALISDSEALGLFAFEKRDWMPGDIIPQGKASLRVVDVVEPAPRSGDGLEVGMLRVEQIGPG